MSENLLNLYEYLRQMMASDDRALVTHETIIEFIKTIRWAVSERQGDVSLIKMWEMLMEAIQSAKNNEAAGKRKGVYFHEGLVYVDGILAKSLKGRYLEIVIYLLQRGEASVSELKMRFWKRNDEEDAKDRDVINAVYNINKAVKKYHFCISSEDRRYKIFPTS